MYFRILLISCSLLSFAAAKVHLVQVHLDLPYHLEFTFDSNEIFEPLALEAHVQRENCSVEFKALKQQQTKNFRNLLPQNFQANDVITAQLYYLVFPSDDNERGSTHNVSFEYEIKDKINDMLLIDTNEAAAGKHQKSMEELSAIMHNIVNGSGGEQPYQTELLQTALSNGNFSTRLLLRSSRPPFGSAVDNIRHILEDELLLSHLAYKILQAKFIDDGLLFEMASSMDAVEVLTKVRLLHSPRLKIETTQREFFEVNDWRRIL